MRVNKIIILAVLCGIGNEVAFAETATPITTDQMSLVQDAVVVDASTVQLTNQTVFKAGAVVLPKLCLKEYKLTFDINVGVGTGAGFVINKMLEAQLSPWMGPCREREFENTFPNGDLNKLLSIHFDTYLDYVLHQRDDNSLYMDRTEKLADNSIRYISLVNETMPFRMKGSGWFTVQLHNVGDLIRLSVIKDSVVILEREGLAGPAEGKEHQFSIYAWTGVAASEQQVRNVSLETIEEDDCRPPLTDEQLAEELGSACGNSTASCDQACYLATMQPLIAASKITDLQMQRFLSLCSTSSCEGESSEPVDLTAIRNQAFAEGVASVNLSTACEPVRQQGFSAGVASVNVEQIRAEAYAAGLRDGKEEGQKVTICHKEKKKVNGVSKRSQHTITVNVNALRAHLAHGDTIGPCATTKPVNK